jgi:recombination associated protein RdgC
VPPLGDENSPLVYAASGYLLFCLQIQEKVLPAGVLREEHMANVKEMEKKLGYRMARGERLKLKEEIIYSLLNKAFSQSKKVYAYIDTKTQQLIVGATSNKTLTQINSLLDKAFYDFAPAEEEIIAPASIFTTWLSEKNYPAAYAILDKCAFEDASSKAKVSFSHKDLCSDSVDCILREGARVTKLSLSWNEKVAFTLDKNFMFTSIKFLDEIKDLAADNLCETAEDRFATDFFIMAETLRDFLAETQAVFLVNNESNAHSHLAELVTATEAATV